MNPPKILSIWHNPSHHQMPLAEELRKILGDNFRMAFLDRPLQYRLTMGWSNDSMEKCSCPCGCLLQIKTKRYQFRNKDSGR